MTSSCSTICSIFENVTIALIWIKSQCRSMWWVMTLLRILICVSAIIICANYVFRIICLFYELVRMNVAAVLISAWVIVELITLITRWYQFCRSCAGDGSVIDHRAITYHYSDVIMGVMSQILSPTIAYSTVYSGADQRKHQSSASLVIMRRIHRWPVDSPHKGPVTRKMFLFDDIIMCWRHVRMRTFRTQI